MPKTIILFFITLSIHLFSQDGFHLSDYKDIVIATDLEPDDVLALKIIFHEANQVYNQNPKKGYPIKLIIVGEGNNTIKKLRMEALLKEYFNLPESIKIDVKSGKSTSDNLFPYDGFELFNEENLKSISQSNEEGFKALIDFADKSQHPLIIQLKPVQELILLSFIPELSKRTDIIFYGSFNFRKSLKDERVSHYFNFTPDQSLPYKMQTLLDHLSKSFNKIGIVESYGVLGEESSVYYKYSWSDPIAKYIKNSNDSFYLMFCKLLNNWNRYLFEEQLKDLEISFNKLKLLCPMDMFEPIIKAFAELKMTWNEEHFQSFCKKCNAIVNSKDSPNFKLFIDKLQHDLQFANQINPRSGIQFTLSDIIVALALSDHSHSFTMSPVKIHVNESAFIQTSPATRTNVFYYDRKKHPEFIEILLSKLKSDETKIKGS